MRVCDTGKGMSKEFVDNHIFHPFSQEDPLLAGTGLGLSIVHSIATSPAVGGEVNVWSVPDVGTDVGALF